MKVLVFLPNSNADERKESFGIVVAKFCPENSLYPLYGQQVLKNVALFAKQKRVTGIIFNNKPVSEIKEIIAYLRKTFPQKQFHYFTLIPLNETVPDVHYFESSAALKAKMLQLSKQPEHIESNVA